MKKLIIAAIALCLSGCAHAPETTTGVIVAKDGHIATIYLHETGETIQTLSFLTVGEIVHLHYDSVNHDWCE